MTTWVTDLFQSGMSLAEGPSRARFWRSSALSLKEDEVQITGSQVNLKKEKDERGNEKVWILFL